jgi:DNA polymerase elongation subunit (family B)
MFLKNEKKYVKNMKPQVKNKFDKLPKRADFITSTPTSAVATAENNVLVGNATTEKLEENNLFLPNRFIFRTGWDSSFLDVIGIVPSGQKCLVRIKNIKIFVDIVKNPETVKITEDFGTETVKMLSGKYFGEPKEFLRVYFKKIKDRRNFIETWYGKWEMGNDDAKPEYLYFRESAMNTAGWNKILGAKKIESENGEKLPVQWEAEGLEGIETPPELVMDKSIICAWDLETYTPNVLGGVPQPHNKADSIKMCSMVFRFVGSYENLCQILITAVPLKIEEKGVFVITTADIPGMFGIILERMQPEFITGFNDGAYDWPFLKSRIKDMEKFRERVGCLKLSRFETHLCNSMGEKFCGKKSIKIEAGQQNAEYDGFQMDSAINFDTMYIMRRANKKEVKFGGLNTFLKIYKLDPKEDMPYTTMSKIFYLWEKTTPEKIKNMDPGSVPFTEDPKIGSISINGLTAAEIGHLFDLTAQVGIYCLRDAAACLDLLVKVSAIRDFREFVTEASCQLEDAFYKADGIKVRNCILKNARKPEWGCWPEKYPLVFPIYRPYTTVAKGKEPEKKKFPGGYVRNPDMGVYYSRPCSGLDAASLYPSIIRAYNISPEYLLMHLGGRNPADWHCIETHYKFDKDPKSEETKIRGYFLKYETASGRVVKNFGIIPTILDRFFIKRKGIKGDMHKWEVILEKLTKDAGAAEGLENILEALRESMQKIIKKADDFVGKKKELELNKLGSFEKAIKFIGEEWRTDKAELISRAEFHFGYYNSKQNVVKVFMNTFYGEMGNSDSPFFIPIMGGAVTKMGRRSIKEIGRLAEQRGFKIYYGDTDSIYISAPEESFKEVDLKYEKGLINKEQYFEEMVGITMSKMQEASQFSNEYFLRTRGTSFLSMAYEEVLFPFGFFGKKNYFGVQHMHSIDFSICRTEDRARFEKELFSRGMPLRRRDASAFIKKILVEILFTFCQMQEKRSYAEIVNDVIKFYVMDTQKNPEKYIGLVQKNYAVKPPNKSKTTTILKFRSKIIRFKVDEDINRGVHLKRLGDPAGDKLLAKYVDRDGNMLDPELKPGWKLCMDSFVVNEDLLDLNFEVPNYGDRYDLVAIKYPPMFKQSGTKVTQPKGEILEYVNMIGNKKYARYLCAVYREMGINILNLNTIEVDFALYFENLFKLLSRYVLFLPQYRESLKDFMAEYAHLGKKECVKRAEQKQMEIIRKEIKMAHSAQYDKIEFDVGTVKEQFKAFKGRYDEVAGKGIVAREILKIFNDPKRELKHLEKELNKSLEEPEIFKAVIDFKKWGMIENRTAKILAIEAEMQNLVGAISKILLNLENKAYYIPELDKMFLRIKQKKKIEMAIEVARKINMQKKGLYVSMTTSILDFL